MKKTGIMTDSPQKEEEQKQYDAMKLRNHDRQS